MKSVMQHSFAKNPSANVSRSSFNRSSGHKTAIDADYLYPIFCDFALPGDTMKMNPTLFARMATPIYPLMDNLFLDTFWFAVPVRTLWTNWEKFLGAQDNPGDSIDYTIPTMTSTTSTGYADSSLHDYIGIRPGVPDFVHSSLWHRAYHAIYNHWFRDENLQNLAQRDTGNGPDTASNYVLLKRGKRHDYFTSCLPWPQKGDTSVTMPLGTSAPIQLGPNLTGADSTDQYVVQDTTSGAEHRWLEADDAIGTSPTELANSTRHMLKADLSSATAATINAMRLAVTTQQFLERDARGGTRIQEIILSHFGVMTLDARLQLPEYLGGNSEMININSVPQSSQTATTPQGTLAAFATGISSGGGFTKSFTEHCIIMGLCNVRADLTYQRGIDRQFMWSTRYDLFWPEFQNIGEQAVLQQEIEMTDPAGGTNDDVFGYQERYGELKFKNSRLSSLMRSDATGTLDPWHLSEELSTPALNATFIKSSTPMARVEAIPSQPDFILDCYFQLTHVRPMQLFGEPGLARF